MSRKKNQNKLNQNKKNLENENHEEYEIGTDDDKKAHPKRVVVENIFKF